MWHPGHRSARFLLLRCLCQAPVELQKHLQWLEPLPEDPRLAKAHDLQLSITAEQEASACQKLEYFTVRAAHLPRMMLQLALDNLQNMVLKLDDPIFANAAGWAKPGVRFFA